MYFTVGMVLLGFYCCFAPNVAFSLTKKENFENDHYHLTRIPSSMCLRSLPVPSGELPACFFLLLFYYDPLCGVKASSGPTDRHSSLESVAFNPTTSISTNIFTQLLRSIIMRVIRPSVKR